MGYKKWTRSVEQLRPDARYNNVLVSKFINCLMYEGKKSVATRVFYDAMDIVAKRVKDAEPLAVFETAVNNVKPNIEVRSSARRLELQVPTGQPEASTSLAIRWLLEATRGHESRATRICGGAHRSFSEGTADRPRKRHRMAGASKAFSHSRGSNSRSSVLYGLLISALR
jgi:small subunit ribosomal protein S7